MNIQRFREEFDFTCQDMIFLNHSGHSPLSNRCARRMVDFIHESRSFSEDSWSTVLRHYDRTRQALGRILKVPTDEIAFCSNTTEGINWVANGIRWRKGDRIVTVQGEYPANVYPWMRVRDTYGVDLHWIRPTDCRVSPRMLEEALTPNTRLLAISWVEFTTGFRFDLEAVGELCRQKDVMLLVDVIQGLGALPIDLKKANVTFAAGGPQKWLMGPPGAGFFYCAKENLEKLEVTTVGATSVAFMLPYLEYDLTLRPTTQRFEYGTLANPSWVGLEAALELLEEAGSETVARRVRLLTDLLVEGLTGKGYRCVSPRGDGEWSGIVSFVHPKQRPEALCDRLWEHRIFARAREGYLRLAPHFYQTEEEMARVVEILA